MQNSSVEMSTETSVILSLAFGLTVVLCILFFVQRKHHKRPPVIEDTKERLSPRVMPALTSQNRAFHPNPLSPVKIQRDEDLPTRYLYTRRHYMMSMRERSFYKRLHHVFGKYYLIFPQIHLNDLLSHDHVRQNWQGALSTIQRKSVDYVICSTDFKILLAIELDDITHQNPDRQERDRMVNYIFQKANLPILRITNVESLSDQQIHYKVMVAMFVSNVPDGQKIQG